MVCVVHMWWAWACGVCEWCVCGGGVYVVGCARGARIWGVRMWGCVRVWCGRVYVWCAHLGCAHLGCAHVGVCACVRIDGRHR